MCFDLEALLSSSIIPHFLFAIRASETKFDFPHPFVLRVLAPIDLVTNVLILDLSQSLTCTH